MEVLSIRNLQKRFGEKKVLQGIDLSVPEHSVFGFVGQNGAGKTTAMKAILGLLRIDGGEIRVMGERVAYGRTPTNRHVGYLPDVPAFYPFMTSEEYLRLCGEGLGMKRSDVQARSEELLSMVGLAGEKSRIKGFSRGMKQRLGIAQALLARPKLLICDEPTSALDPIGRKDILEILSAARQETTVLFSTHILSDVERICTDVALLHNGRIEMQGAVEELKRTHYTEELAVEAETDAATQALMHAFPDACQRDGAVVIRGGEERMREVLGYLHAHAIPIRKIERLEPSMESLFLEVVGK